MKAAIAALYEHRCGTWEPREGFKIRVGVLDARKDAGRLRLLITPSHGTGTGQTWVDAQAVALDEKVTGPDARD